jgi:hypothetical protein
VNNAGIYPSRGRKIVIHKDSVICHIFQVANFTLNSPTMNVFVAAARQEDSRVHAAVRFYSHTLQRIRQNFSF